MPFQIFILSFIMGNNKPYELPFMYIIRVKIIFYAFSEVLKLKYTRQRQNFSNLKCIGLD